MTTENSRAYALTITEDERDGNWYEFAVNGHGGLIRVVARMEDDDEDYPLGKRVRDFLLAASANQPAAAPIDDLRQEVLRLCRLFLDDEQGKYNAKAVMTQIFSVAATPAPSPVDERAAKLYHGRTTAELKEICSTRPAHYPEAHHEFDKTILALIDEIERLQARAASASRTDAVIEALKQAGLFLTNYEPETICTVVQSLLKRAASANETGAEGAKRGTPEQIQAERKLTCEAIDGAMAFGYQNTNPPPSADHWLAPYWHIGRKQAELESRARAMAEDAAPPSGYAYRYSHHGGAVIRFNNGGEVNGSRPIEAVPYWFAAPPPAQADARVGHKSEGE